MPLLDDGIVSDIHGMSLRHALEFYAECEQSEDWVELYAELGLADRFFLLSVLLNAHYACSEWVYMACREVEAAPDGHIDLWSREHFKSSTITYAGIIQSVMRDQEVTVGIFSHTKPIAKGFLKQIKREFESNELLKSIYPEILYANPAKESPMWNEDAGIIVKRSGNPREATVEASGLVDGMPTSRHYKLRVYDDVVTRESVTTPEQIAKTTEALDLSQALGSDGGRVWYIGTRYHMGDTYQTILDRGAAIPRIKPATEDGTPDGKPVLWSQAYWDEKKLNSSDFVIACQYLQNPTAGTQSMFNKEWLRVYELRPETLNIYIMVDPASSRKVGSDATAMAVLGVDHAGNKYLLDGYRHKMNLLERWDNMRNLRRTWINRPGVQLVRVGYERYGMQSDLEYFEERMRLEGESFDIVELAWPREGGGSKADRVQRLLPDHKRGRIYLPARLKEPSSAQKKAMEDGRPHIIAQPIKRKDQDGRIYDLSESYIEEYIRFPFAVHDDLIDAVSRIYDMDYTTPTPMSQYTKYLEPEYAD